MQTVWLVVGKSESGDDYSAVFSSKPSEEKLKQLVYSWDGDEEEDGSGYAGSYVNINLSEEIVDDEII